MKKVIVTTTINPPTEALKKFNKLKDWELIVVGDLKTPHDLYGEYNYISPEEQEKRYPELSKLIGWNCIQRRNIGFIEAYNQGADIIATIDDDNIPYKGWGDNLLIGTEQKVYNINNGDLVFDPLSATSYANLWHRGFPIQCLSDRLKPFKVQHTTVIPDIQADLWNGEPDIDAICRMQFNTECNFTGWFPFITNSFSPFNSQNTFISREALKHYFMFPGIGRMDDIWASYYLEALGYKVVYNKPSVHQKRNDHIIMKDFEDELLGYRRTYELIKKLNTNPENIKKVIPKKSWLAFEEYQRCLIGI